MKAGKRLCDQSSRGRASQPWGELPEGKWDELFSWLIDSATSYFTRREGKTYRKQKRRGIAPRLNYNHTRRLVCVWVSECAMRREKIWVLQFGLSSCIPWRWHLHQSARRKGHQAGHRGRKQMNEQSTLSRAVCRERRLKCSRRFAHPLIRPIRRRRAALAKNSIRNFAPNDERPPAATLFVHLTLCFVVFALNWSTLCVYILSWRMRWDGFALLSRREYPTRVKVLARRGWFGNPI